MKKLIYGLLIAFVALLFTGCDKTENKEEEYDKTLSCLLQYDNDQGSIDYKVYYKDEVAKKVVHKNYINVPVSEDVPLDAFYQSYTEQYAGINDDHKYEVVVTKEGSASIGLAYVFEFDKVVDYDAIEMSFVLEKDYNIEDYKTLLTSHGFNCEIK